MAPKPKQGKASAGCLPVLVVIAVVYLIIQAITHADQLTPVHVISLAIGFAALFIISQIVLRLTGH